MRLIMHFLTRWIQTTAALSLFDDVLGGWKRYRRVRGGRWQYASCPDGGWIRDEPARPDFPRVEDYDSGCPGCGAANNAACAFECLWSSLRRAR